MANNFDSNITRKLARVFLEKFVSSQIQSKNVNTQLLNGKFNPTSGDKVDFKRPTDYVSKRTPDGDVSASAPSDIITGKATGTVQDYFTVNVDYDEADEAIKMDQLDQLLNPMATRIVTDMELDFSRFMMRNTGLIAGNPDTAVSVWDDIANAGAMLQSHGVPMDESWFYSVNPFTQRSLASDQRSLGAGGNAGALITAAHEKATITQNFGGFDRVMTATTLGSYTNDAEADRAGVLSSTPDPTYLTAKDTMQQTLAVSGIGAGGDVIVPAGTTVELQGHSRLNLSTRQTIFLANGAHIPWTATVLNDTTLTGGAGNLVVSGPAIFEAGGAYNTVSAPLTSGDTIVLLGNADAIIQPNLFWHKQAFSIGSVPLKKLYATDTVATTESGFQIRVTKYADGDANKQKVRFDLRCAYAALNPFLAGQGFGGA